MLLSTMKSSPPLRFGAGSSLRDSRLGSDGGSKVGCEWPADELAVIRFTISRSSTRLPSQVDEVRSAEGRRSLDPVGLRGRESLVHPSEKGGSSFRRRGHCQP